MIKFLQAVPMTEKILLSPHRDHIVQVTWMGKAYNGEKKIDLSGCRANNCREDRCREQISGGKNMGSHQVLFAVSKIGVLIKSSQAVHLLFAKVCWFSSVLPLSEWKYSL